jgi:glycosyltransferase involved in cell wall biosynthesis
MIISIITIVKNGMPFIRDTISSVIAQTYPHIEYIIIDGNSTDGTFECVNEHMHAITRYISEDDAGIAEAFNKGLKFATGEYVLFLNADDALVNPEVLNQIAREISKNQYPDFLYGDCEVIERGSSQFLYRSSIDITIKDFLRGSIFPHPSTFTKKSYFQKYGSFDNQFKIAMDYEFFMRGIQESRIIHVPTLVTRVRNGGVSTIDGGRVVSEIILALKKNGYLQNYFAEDRLRFYFWIRKCVRSFLSTVGIYKKFQEVRNYIKNTRTSL